MNPKKNKTKSALHNAGRDLTTGSIPRHLLIFAAPMLLDSMLQTSYNLINAVWVGKGLGTDAMAAITEGLPVIFVLMSIAMGLTMATNILVSQSYGAKDWGQLKRVIQNSTILVGVATIVCMLIGEFSAESLLRVMGTKPRILPMATQYLQIFLLTTPAMFGSFLMNSLLRGIGDSKTPLYFRIVAVVVTALLDPVLMFGWFGLPKFGLNGTAYATIITSTMGFLALAIFLRRRKSPVSPDWRRLRADWETSWLTLKIGVPVMFQQVLVSVGMLVIVSLVNRYGESAVAAYGAGMRIDQLAFMPAMTIGMAVATLAGQNIGAKQYHRVHEVFWWGLALSGGITLLVSIFVVTVPKFLLLPFTSDPGVIAIGVNYLRIIGIGYLLFSAMFITNGIANGAGHTFITSLFTMISLWLFRVPLSMYLANVMHKPEGIWYGIVISTGIGMIMSLWYYISGRWKRPITKRGPAPAHSAIADVEAGDPLAELPLELD